MCDDRRQKSVIGLQKVVPMHGHVVRPYHAFEKDMHQRYAMQEQGVMGN